MPKVYQGILIFSIQPSRESERSVLFYIKERYMLYIQWLADIKQ